MLRKCTWCDGEAVPEVMIHGGYVPFICSHCGTNIGDMSSLELRTMVRELHGEVELLRHSRKMYITDLLHLAGCRCHKPDIGFRAPENFPRCKICDVDTKDLIQNVRAEVAEQRPCDEI